MQVVRLSLLLACGWETEAFFRSLQHAIYKKGRNRRLWFSSLLLSNPSYYRTGTMFMMDSFREHFLPAHVTVLQTEAKAVWGVIKAADVFQYHVQLSASKAHTRRWASDEELAWPVENYIQFLIVPQCSPIALASPTLQGTTVRRGRKFRSIHTICHLLFQQATSVFLEGFILASAWIKCGITPWPFLSSSPASLTHTQWYRFPCTTVTISPAVHSTSTSSLIHMYRQNHCAHRDQFIFPSPVASFILCRKKLAASNKECYE